MRNKLIGTILCSTVLLAPIVLSSNESPVAAEEDNKILNGDFSDGTTHWGTIDVEGGVSNFTVDETGIGQMHIEEIAGMHPEWDVPISWSSQLVQEEVEIESGYTYELAFDAASTLPRPIEVEFTGLSGQDNVSFLLNEEMNTFTYEFDYTLQATSIDFKFLVGYVVDGEYETPAEEHMISFDNISLRAVSEIEEGDAEEIDWQLVWSDEFDGDSLDLSKWRYDIGNYILSGDEWVPGWGNNESQFYQEDNVRVEDGRLIIEAREESVSDEHDTYDYTSGKIMTDGHFSQTYGRFEARMKLPAGQGFWPAFWMMPQDDVYGGWAASGEIDIMENRGDYLNTVGAAVHFGGGWPNNTHTHGEYTFQGDTDITDFNVYSLEWGPGELRWYVNDDLYYRTSDWYSENGEYPAPFDQDFYLILNLAVGGWYGLEPDESTPFPSQVEVDYVRVYEDPNVGEIPTPDPDPDPEIPEDPENPEEEFDVNDWREIGENLIQDGTFEQMDAWSTHNQGDYEDWAGLASFDILDEVLNVTVEQIGWEWWHIQLFQEVTLPSGFYKLAFDMTSEFPRDVYVELTDTQTGIYDFSINEEMNTYETIIEITEDSDSQLLFGFGRNADDPESQIIYNMFLDNVSLVEVERIEEDGDEESDPVPEDPEDDEPIEEDPVEEDPTDDELIEEEPTDSDGEDSEQDTEESDKTKEDTEEDTGERLPQTATATWTLGAIGALGVVSGGVLKIVKRKKK